MKPNELMIGDWVANPINEKPMRVMSLTRDIELGLSGFYDNVTPIPITAEILERNGFVKNKYGEMILDEELGTSEIYLVLEPTYDEEYYWWRVNNELITKIKSVHELQHILRLCNIDKEIEI